MSGAQMLEKIVLGHTGPFALIYRPNESHIGQVEILFGEVRSISRLEDIPRPDGSGPNSGHEALVLIPHRQIAERGFVVQDDSSPLLAMLITEQGSASLSEASNSLPNDPITLSDGAFDIADDAYADIVRKVLDDAIATGDGSNFVIKRSFVAQIANYSARSALTLFRRLLTMETSAHWTFLIHTGKRIFVGATPERHVTLQSGKVVMNPISGTYRYPRSGPTIAGLLQFLADPKEMDELYMVLDEELKMMGRICAQGGRVLGPHLREMARLAHTEYFIEGESVLDARDILRETMFCPTVVGSPLENACRVISRYERGGRAYYGGVAALIGRDANGSQVMDSAILIRTADIDHSSSATRGSFKISVGATLVRHSNPSAEVAETHAKVAGVMSAFDAGPQMPGGWLGPRLGAANAPEIQAALATRNSAISRFWLLNHAARQIHNPALEGRRVLIVDAEDTFTSMLAHQLRSIGLLVDVTRFDCPNRPEAHDLLVLGPGPGDPRDQNDARIAHMSSLIDHMLTRKLPFFAVCLSHQILCRQIGFNIIRRATPNQGVQKEINLYETARRVGFYNSYIALSPFDRVERSGIGSVLVSRDNLSGEVYAVRGSHFSSVQFHIESILTQDGPELFSEFLTPLMLRGMEKVA